MFFNENFSLFLRGPTLLPELWFEQILICTTCVFTRVPVFCLFSILRIFSIFSYDKFLPPPPPSTWLWPNATLRIMIWSNFDLHYLKMLYKSYTVLAYWFLSRRFCVFSHFFSMKKFDPHCGPTLTQGIMIWTIFNLQYLRMLKCLKVKALLVNWLLRSRF